MKIRVEFTKEDSVGEKFQDIRTYYGTTTVYGLELLARVDSGDGTTKDLRLDVLDSETEMNLPVHSNGWNREIYYTSKDENLGISTWKIVDKEIIK